MNRGAQALGLGTPHRDLSPPSGRDERAASIANMSPPVRETPISSFNSGMTKSPQVTPRSSSCSSRPGGQAGASRCERRGHGARFPNPSRVPVAALDEGRERVDGANAEAERSCGPPGRAVPSRLPLPMEFELLESPVRHHVAFAGNTWRRSEHPLRIREDPERIGSGRESFANPGITSEPGIPGCPSDDVLSYRDRRRSAARLPTRGPWLCVPASRSVCLCRVIFRERGKIAPHSRLANLAREVGG